MADQFSGASFGLVGSVRSKTWPSEPHAYVHPSTQVTVCGSTPFSTPTCRGAALSVTS